MLSEKTSRAVNAAFTWVVIGALITLVTLLLFAGCATPHTPTRVLPQSLPSQSVIDSDSGYVYDELLADSGVTLDKEGKIVAASPGWAKKALGRVLDLQQALDECNAERRALSP